MKKNYLLILFILLLFPLNVFSEARVDISKNNLNFIEGKTYSIPVFIDPKGEQIFTAKIEISYPVDMIVVNSFSFNDSWIELRQPGYDLIDNANGLLIKSGGYPSGVSSKVLLGYISLRSKKSGIAELGVTDNSSVLDVNNDNILETSNSSISLNIQPKPVVEPTENIKKSEVIEDDSIDKEVEEVDEVLFIEPEKEYVLSPDKRKVLLYSQLALLSILDFILGYKIVLYTLLLVLFYILFRIVLRFVKRK
ncbi:MAG: hypothetical protein ACI840_001279 [Ulvibacter sp.]|jgi:hypothetical protein